MATTDHGSGKTDVADATAGEKRQIDHDDPDSKRAKTEKTERQMTLEESLGKTDGGGGDNDESKDSKDTKAEADTSTHEESAVKPSEESDVPASILEKGIVYFFIRGRVGIDKPKEVNDVARSYMLLRPIDKDAKLGHGTLGDAGNTRLLALPKKVLPRSGKDRFMVFVEKASASYEEIKRDFLSGSDYETKTAGTRHSPAATPVGEGVYAMTTTGRESHLVYMSTLPEKLDEVQEELGVKDKGSFIISTKNPKYPGPANTQLPEGPGYPKEVLDEFKALRWMPSKPEHFDYVNSQILLIGESKGIDKALEPQKEDEKDGKEEPLEVLEHLEEEDLKRMRDLPGDQSDSVFADLQAHADEYPKLKTTF